MFPYVRESQRRALADDANLVEQFYKSKRSPNLQQVSAGLSGIPTMACRRGISSRRASSTTGQSQARTQGRPGGQF